MGQAITDISYLSISWAPESAKPVRTEPRFDLSLNPPVTEGYYILCTVIRTADLP